MGERIDRKRPPPPVRPRPIAVTEAEDALCGSIVLWGSEVLFEATELGLRPDQLSQQRAQGLYRAAMILADRGTPIDVFTLQDQLRRTGELELFGSAGLHPLEGLSALDQLALSHGRSVRGIVGVIQQASAQRLAHAVANGVIERISEGDIDPTEWPGLVQRWASDLTTLASTGDLTRAAGWSIDDVLDRVEVEWESEAAGNVRGISTGFAEWDKVLGRVGPRPPWLVGLAGRPGMGKSTLAQSMTLSCVLPHLRGVPRAPDQPPQEPVPVLWACSEMTAEEIARSLVSSVGDLERRAVESPDRQWMRRTAAQRRRAIDLLRGSALTFVPDDQAGILEEIELVARNWRSKHARELGRDGEPGRRKPALLVIDYLQRLKARGWKGQKREEEINYLAQSLKTLARGLDVVVLMLCQLNRSVEGRADKRPQLGDLRESGAIEQECDVVSFVYRDHYYHPDKSPVDGAEIITAKNRKGPLETVHVRFEGQYSRFLDLPAPGEPPLDDYDYEF